MFEAVLKLIIFTSMVNRIISTSRNERVTQQVYDTYSRNGIWWHTGTHGWRSEGEKGEWRG